MPNDALSALPQPPQARFRRHHAAKRTIYFLAGGGLVKIGITANLTSRLRAIRNSSPVQIELLATMRECDLLLEMMLHQRFAALRRHGEWFEDDGAIRRPVKTERVITNRKMATAACSLLRRALRHKGVRKDAPLIEALGYSPADLRAHLERLFQPGMSWANYGRHGWHVDHHRPINTFPKSASIREINAISNLRPLWEKENCGRRNCG